MPVTPSPTPNPGGGSRPPSSPGMPSPSLPRPPQPAFTSGILSPPPKPVFINRGEQGGVNVGGAGSEGLRAGFFQVMKESAQSFGQIVREEIEKSRLNIFGERGPGAGTGLQNRPEALNINWQHLLAIGLASGAGQRIFAGAGNIAGNVLRGAAAAVPSLGPLVVGGGIGAAVYLAIRQAIDAGGVHAESQRALADVSPSMAAAFNESDIRGRQRALISGERLAPSNRELLHQLDRFRDNMAQIKDSWDEFKNNMFAGFIEVFNELAEPLIQWVHGQRNKADQLPFVQKLIDMAREEEAAKMAQNQRWAKAGIQPINVPPGMNIGWLNGRMVFQPKDPNFIGPPAPVGGN